MLTARLDVALSGLNRCATFIGYFNKAPMLHLAAAIFLELVWVACNFYLWSLKQAHWILFWESLGMAAIAFPAVYWYVTRRTN